MLWELVANVTEVGHEIAGEDVDELCQIVLVSCLALDRMSCSALGRLGG